MSITKPTRTLQNAKYSFDASRNAWNCGKKPVDEEEVLIDLIRYAKSVSIPDAGAWAVDALADAKTTPELTTRAFAKRCIIRNRNNRIAGKYLFMEWARAVGIEITGKLEEFMVRNSLLVSRFYNELAAVFGDVCKSVFFGIDIRVSTDFTPADVPKIVVSSQSPKIDALRRYLEFMRNTPATRSSPKSRLCASLVRDELAASARSFVRMRGMFVFVHYCSYFAKHESL